MSELTKALRVLDQIEEVGTKLTPKKELLEENRDNPYLYDLFYYTYNPFLRYYVYPEQEGYVTFNNDPPSKERWSRLRYLLDAFSKRQITGNKARDMLEEFIGTLSEHELKWYVRLFNRDLRLGVNIKTLRKVWNTIPLFGVQLASTYKEGSIEFPCYAEPKIDGIRMVFVISAGAVTAYSRLGKENENVGHVVEELGGLDDCVLDGEMYGIDWGSTSGLLHRKKLSKKDREKLKQVKFHVFDYMPLDDFRKGRCRTSYTTRRMALRDDLIDRKKLVAVVPVSRKVVRSADEIPKLMEFYLSKGWEGMMLKTINGKYITDRSKDWQKVKPFVDYEAVVLGFEEGNGKHKGKLGALVVKIPSGETVNIGSGFTDAQREEVWKNRKKYLGKKATVKVQDDKAAVATARFPTFLRWRKD